MPCTVDRTGLIISLGAQGDSLNCLPSLHAPLFRVIVESSLSLLFFCKQRHHHHHHRHSHIHKHAHNVGSVFTQVVRCQAPERVLAPLSRRQIRWLLAARGGGCGCAMIHLSVVLPRGPACSSTIRPRYLDWSRRWDSSVLTVDQLMKRLFRRGGVAGHVQGRPGLCRLDPLRHRPQVHARGQAAALPHRSLVASRTDRSSGTSTTRFLMLENHLSHKAHTAEWEHNDQCEKRRSVSLCVKTPTWPVCDNRQSVPRGCSEGPRPATAASGGR